MEVSPGIFHTTMEQKLRCLPSMMPPSKLHDSTNAPFNASALDFAAFNVTHIKDEAATGENFRSADLD